MGRLISLAMEAEGKHAEQEAVIYCKIGDRLGLQQARSVEHQLQAQIKTDVGSIRVRCTSVGSQFGKRTASTETRYEQTTKVLVPGQALKTFEEDTKTISEELFKQFLGVAPSYMNKTRYTFDVEKVTITADGIDSVVNVNGITFEVDVFMTANNEISEWCKIDVEVQNLSKALIGTPFEKSELNLKVGISGLPFKPTDFILESGEENPDKRALITELYETQFLIKNPRLVAA